MESGSASNSFLRNPLRKTSTNNINNRMGDVCCFVIILVFKRSFPQGQNRRINTEHMGRDIEPESLAFIYKNTVACITSAVITFSEVKETIAPQGQQDNESIL